MRKILGTALALPLLLVVGCDGYYSYPFHGQLVTADHGAVAPGMSVHALPRHGGEPPATFDAEFGITDAEGKFTGTLQSPMTWVPSLRPEPPVIHEWNLVLSNGRETMTLPVEVSDAQQKLTKNGQREIDLGVITLPSLATSQPTTKE